MATSNPVSLYQDSNLASFLKVANNAPVLSAEHEARLARQFRDDENVDAARELVVSQLRHVIHVAKGFTGYGLPVSDLIQEGNIGLMKAVKNFDPERGIRLVSYAVHWIKAEIYEYNLDVPIKSVREMEQRMTSTDVAFDGADSDDDDFVTSPSGYLPDMRYNPEELVMKTETSNNNKNALYDAIADLDDRSNMNLLLSIMFLQNAFVKLKNVQCRK